MMIHIRMISYSYYFAAHCRNVTVLRYNIICDICYFSSATLLLSLFISCCKLLSFFINICCFGGMFGACLGIFNALSSGLRLLNFILIAPTPLKLWRHIDLSRWRPRHPNFSFEYVFGDFEVEICLDTKFWWYFSVHGWDIIISSFSKQTSTMLKFYHVIFHLPAKFRPNRTIRDRVMTSYPFFKMAVTVSQFDFWFRFSWVRSLRNVEFYLQTKFRRNISIHSWDNYYYFRFLKTNVRHVGILLLVSIFTFASSFPCHSASACQISSKSDHRRQSYDVMSILPREHMRGRSWES